MSATEYPSRDAWLAARRKVIGSSDARALFGCGYSGESPLSVYASKVSDEPERRSEAEQKRLRKGQIGEEFVLRLFEEQEGIGVSQHREPCLYRNPNVPYVGASLDAWTPGRSGNEVVEAKLVGRHAAHEWEDDHPPLGHMIQVQHQLWCTGWKSGYLVGWDGADDVKVYRIARNDDFIELLHEKCHRFWHNHVLPRIPPEPDGSDGSAEAIRRLFPVDSGAVVALGHEEDELLAELGQIKEQAKQLEKRRGEIENRVKMLLGEATYGVLPSGRAVSWKLQERAEYTVKASSYRVLRVHEKQPKELRNVVATPVERRGVAC